MPNSPKTTMRITVTTLAAALFLSTPALAQIPETPQAPGAHPGTLAPHVDCNVCGERSYTAPAGAPLDKDGNVIAWCMHCKRDTPHHSPGGSALGLRPSQKSVSQHTGTDGLRLRGDGPNGPDKNGSPESNAGAQSKPAAAPTQNATAPVAPSAPLPGLDPHSPAVFVLNSIRKLGPDDKLAHQAVASLDAMGESGLAAARAALFAEEPALIVTGGRVLVHSSLESDRDLVANRLRTKLPPSAGAPLLEALVAADPVRASPRFLCEMLDSSHAGIRTAAEKELRPLLAPEIVPLLEATLASKRSETRQRALALLCTIDDPSVNAILLAHIADPSPKVAGDVVSELAGRKQENLEHELVTRAFSERWILRSNAYALLAIIEREDMLVKPILNETHVDALLGGLSSNDAFISGTCAAALAGIGFRSAHPRSTTWLDADVVDRLVTTVSGKEFHNDFGSLQGPALRRLRLVSGQEFSSDGPRWVEWWLAARNGFYARRAILEIDASDIPRIALRTSARGDNAVPIALVGPGEDPGLGNTSAPDDVLTLSLAQARDLFALFEREGVLGPERLPGQHGARSADEVTLEVGAAGRGKRFVFAPGTLEPWAEKLIAAAKDLSDKNRWQRYPTPAHHSSSRALWQEQGTWWAEEHSELARALRLKSLVFAWLPMQRDLERDRGIAELERLYRDPKVREAADFTPLLQLLRDSLAYAPRTGRLTRLALAAGHEAGSAGDEHQGLPSTLARELVSLLSEHYGVAARPEITEVARAAGPGFVALMARDPRPLLRATSAAALALDGSPESLALLAQLLSDKDTAVEIAAVDALGEKQIETARTELLVRARLGLKPVRIAALRAVGKLGGEFVLDALLLGATDPDPEVRIAAVEGLSLLADPSSASMFVQMLGDGPSSPMYSFARAGLRRLGAKATPELLRVVHSPTHRARLEAARTLSEMGAADAASPLMTALTQNPKDAALGLELATLTCIDFRAEPDPANAWWNWWDGVVHDDAAVWFRAALERAELKPPPREAFEGAGTAQGRQFLLGVLERPEPWLAERARRELEQLTGHELGALPPSGAARAAWIRALRESVPTMHAP